MVVGSFDSESELGGRFGIVDFEVTDSHQGVVVAGQLRTGPLAEAGLDQKPGIANSPLNLSMYEELGTRQDSAFVEGFSELRGLRVGRPDSQ